MPKLGYARAARLAVAFLALVSLAGCPELNQWSGPSKDPFFSVPDPVPEHARSESPDEPREPSPGWRRAQ